MKIRNDFDGANIRVLSQNENRIFIDVDLRDSSDDWFYWCFKVEGAAGKTLEFIFPNENRVGYFGAAVSHDMKAWRWQHETSGHQGGSFTYTFHENENEVYFAHDMLYRPERFYAFANEYGLEIKELCKSGKGRSVPFIDTAIGDKTILLTARHHACEATGSYVLEGVLKSLLTDKAFSGYRIICVPFVDFDGVLDGDQGKGRIPFDHNRDYDASKPAMYNSVRKIRELAGEIDIVYAFDFHSPWHLGGENDRVFIPIKSRDAVEEAQRFSKIFESLNNPNALPHFADDDMLPDIGWNKVGTPTFAVFMQNTGSKLAFSLETPYFMASGTKFSQGKALNTGKNFAKALKGYIL